MRGENARTIAGLSATAVALILSLSVLSICVPPVSAGASEVVGPYVASPRLQPVSPWEEVTIMTNITDYVAGTRSVTLFYSIDPMPPRRYVSVPMTLVYGDERNGSYSAQIPPQANQTDVYFFTSTVDNSGQEDKSPFDEENPNDYKVVVFPSRFVLTYIAIRNLDSRTLTTDMEVTFEAYVPLAGQQPQSITIRTRNNNWDYNETVVPLSESEKYTYRLSTVLKGFHLIGDASPYPLDRYHLDLSFNEPWGVALANSGMDTVSFTEYPAVYFWKCSSIIVTDSSSTNGATIRVGIDLARRTESSYSIILPLLLFFVLLGAVPLFSLDRLTVRVAICGFVLTYAFAWLPNQISASVPVAFSGATFANAASTSLGIYGMIFLIGSGLAFVLAKWDTDEERDWSFYLDIAASCISLILLVWLPLTANPYLAQTLFGLASAASLGGFNCAWVIIAALVWGVVFRGVFLRLRKHKAETRQSAALAEVIEKSPSQQPKVFIAYGGRRARVVAKDMTQCLSNHGISPCIPVPSCVGSISSRSLEEVLRAEMDCDAVLAVNTDESYNSSKFIMEIERVSQSPIPLIGFIEKPGKIIQLLQTNCTRVFFEANDHMRYCSEVAEKVLSEISYARQGAILSEVQLDSRNGAP